MGIKEIFLKACDDVKNTAKKVTNSVKNEYKKNQLTKELDDMYLMLGKIRFVELSEQKDNSEESEKIFAEIVRLKSEIASFAEATSSAQACEVCGKELSDDVTYCPYCGTEIKCEECEENE